MNWLKRLIFRRKMESDLDKELRFHIESQVADKMQHGISESEARRLTRLEFGGVEQVKEDCRESRGTLWLESAMQDISYCLRQLRNAPGFTLAAILTLALGVGANTAVFSVVHAVLLKPLPYKNPASLVWPTFQFPKNLFHNSFVPHPTYFAWRDQNHVFSGIAAIRSVGNMTLTGADTPERITITRVSANIFSVLGTDLAQGRSFTEEEERPSGPRAVILSYGLWQSRYGRKPNILGHSITLNGENHVIVGVLPANFQLPTLNAQPQVFLPLAISADASNEVAFFSVVARLKPGITLAQVNADLSLIDDHTFPQLPKFFSRYTQESHLGIISLHDQLTESIRDPLLLLMAAVGFLLLIACVNVANLQLSRGAVRLREFTVRAALGASRMRLARQLFTENMLLSAAGGLVGCVGAFWGVLLLHSFVPQVLLDAGQARVNAASLVFAIAVTAFAGIISGFAPILALFKPNLSATMCSGRAYTAGSRKNGFFRNLLVVAEVAASAILLIAAGLLLNSFLRLANVRSGFDTHNLLTAELFLPPGKYPSDAQQTAFAAQLLERMSAIPGVRSASLSISPPNKQYEDMRIGIEGRPVPAMNDLASMVSVDSVSNSYFYTLGIPIVSGRGFDSSDGPQTVKVAVVNQEFVRAFFPQGENPIGKRIINAPGTAHQTPVSIVGVCEAIRRTGREGKEIPQIFLPFAQSPTDNITVLLRTTTDPDAVAPALRSSVLTIDKELPLANIAAMEDLLASEIAGQRFEAAAVGLFAALALTLAGIGIYGVISYMVSQRTHEIGVRMAVGAQRANVLRMVMRDGVVIAGAGAAIGTGGALLLARLLQSLLFHITATDPVTYSAAIVILLGVALLACYIPARRATKIDPMVALRYE